MPLRDLKPSTRNARTHSKKQIDQIANSIFAFGWTYPILADEHGDIIAGAGRSCSRASGSNKVPVLVMSGLSDAEKRALALADNKIRGEFRLGSRILAAELGELATFFPNAISTSKSPAFEPAEIDALVADFGDSEQDPADEAPAASSRFADQPQVRRLGARRSSPVVRRCR